MRDQDATSFIFLNANVDLGYFVLPAFYLSQLVLYLVKLYLVVQHDYVHNTTESIINFEFDLEGIYDGIFRLL